MLEVAPTSIQSQKGMRAQHPRLSRSRRDTPSKGAKARDPTLPFKDTFGRERHLAPYNQTYSRGCVYRAQVAAPMAL